MEAARSFEDPHPSPVAAYFVGTGFLVVEDGEVSIPLSRYLSTFIKKAERIHPGCERAVADLARC